MDGTFKDNNEFLLIDPTLQILSLIECLDKIRFHMKNYLKKTGFFSKVTLFDLQLL